MRSFYWACTVQESGAALLPKYKRQPVWSSSGVLPRHPFFDDAMTIMPENRDEQGRDAGFRIWRLERIDRAASMREPRAVGTPTVSRPQSRIRPGEKAPAGDADGRGRARGQPSCMGSRPIIAQGP